MSFARLQRDRPETMHMDGNGGAARRSEWDEQVAGPREDLVGLDLAKNVFQVYGADVDGSPLFNRNLRRGEVLRFFERLPPCLVGLEACGSSHYWAREIVALGHDVRLIPPVYVKPFVKRGKIDAADAEAISEAVTRKTMRFVSTRFAHTYRS